MNRTGPSPAASVRPLCLADDGATLHVIGENSQRFAAGGLACLPSSTADFSKWIAAPRDPGKAQKVVYGIWTGEADHQALVGFVGIETLNRFAGAGLWYGIDRSAQGRGLAKTGILLAMADFSSRAVEAGLAPASRWILHVHKSNPRSAALGASLGFQRDELLDYTRQTSTRGGQRFQGYFNERSASSIAAEANARQAAALILAQISDMRVSHSSSSPQRRRLPA